MPMAPVLPAVPAPLRVTTSTAARVRQADVGHYPGGAAPDGIHPLTRRATVEYDDTDARVRIIDAFIRERAGYQPFFFRFEPTGNHVLVRCPRWGLPQSEDGPRSSMVLEIIEDHAPGYTPGSSGVVTLDITRPVRATAVTARIVDADTPIRNLTWQWQRGDTDIAGATSARYTPVLADVGKTLRAVASYADAFSPVNVAVSVATGAVTNTTDQPGTVTLDDTTPIRATAVTASLADADGGIENLTWQWQRAGVNIAGATSASYTPVLADVGKTLRAVASYDDAQGTDKTATSAATGAVTNTRDRAGVVTIDNVRPLRATAITASLADADGGVTNLTWQWQRAGVNIAGATSASYTPVLADVGKKLLAVASYDDAHGPGKAAAGRTHKVGNTVDQAGVVTLDDTTPVRATAVTASLADADGGIENLTWQWQRAGVNIAGATAASYTPVREDVGKSLRAVASYDDAHGPGKTATSAATAAVINTPDQFGRIVLNPFRDLVVGQEITATLTDPDGGIENVVWEWVRAGATIAGATSSSYTTVPADVGKKLYANARYDDAQGTSKTATSAPTKPVQAVPDRPGTVTLDDTTPAQGQKITASLSDPDGGIKNLTWQWQRAGVNITGATASSYTPVQADVGKTLRAVASYDDAHRTGRTATSAATAKVADTDDPGTVTLDDTTPVQGQKITAVLSDPDGGLKNITWQWQRGTVNIPGATAASYTPVQADVGKTLRAIASYTDAQGKGKTATSGATGKVADTDDPGVVTLDSAKPRAGVEITASLSDPDGGLTNITWQWQRAGVNISGATAASYTPVQADVGKTLRAVASYTDAQGSGKTATSAATAAVLVATVSIELALPRALVAASNLGFWHNLNLAVPANWMAGSAAGALNQVSISAAGSVGLTFSADLDSGVEADLTLTLTVGDRSFTSKVSDSDDTTPYIWDHEPKSDVTAFLTYLQTRGIANSSGTLTLTTGASI